MRISKFLIVSLIFVLLPTLWQRGFAQNDKNGSYKITGRGLVYAKTTDSLSSERVILKPILILRSKYEVGTESGYSRFTMRSSRVGVEGSLTKMLSYNFLVDLSDNGKFRILDLYARFNISERFSFTLGQHGLLIFNSWTTSPHRIDFVNRQFISKFFAYSRDLGITANYKIKKDGFPITVEAGIYNGEGMNNPEWTKTPAWGGRLAFGSMDGFRSTAKMFKNKEGIGKEYIYWGADARYENKEFRVETEFLARENSADDSLYDTRSLYTMYAQTLWKIPVSNNLISMVQPCARWDTMGYDILDNGFGVNRATVGANVVLNTPVGNAMLKLNYEHYFNTKQDLSAVFGSARNNENKASLELLLYF